MPINPRTLLFRRLTRTLSFSGAAALLISAAAETTQAAVIQGDSWLSSFFSTYGITTGLLGFLAALFLFRRYLTKRENAEFEARMRGKKQPALKHNSMSAESSPAETATPTARRAQRVESSQAAEKQADSAAAAFGAYRVDQEVSKLVVGKPHRMDVMASRVADDRRAIEASLIKALESSDTTEDGRRRAREALEEYGFVARQSATMLMGRDAWERSSAARTLGQIGSQSSLPFLIEALHDGDSVVRNQAISSLGLLKMPVAIGALLDIARRHTDIPAALLSESLSACSVESLGYLDGPFGEQMLFGSGSSAGEPADLERLVAFEDLADGDDDPDLAEALEQLEGADESTRALLAQRLSMHPLKNSVSALTSMVVGDPSSSVRAAAVASLGAIDHESVLAPVLLALADEARIVQAAAARTLTSLHFDRADAYVRIMEKATPQTIRDVAHACVKTGIAAQAVDRLASEDRYQAFEAFSLFSLLARADETAPIFEVIEKHQDEEVRLCAVRVLNISGKTANAPKLRELAAQQGMPENVRTAILEVLYKFDRNQPQLDQPLMVQPDLEPLLDLNAGDNVAVTLHNSP